MFPAEGPGYDARQMLERTGKEGELMSESTGKKEWETPAVTVLGDLETLTQIGTNAGGDGINAS